MFKMGNEMRFDEPPEVVFDFLSDDRNEALWEPPNVSMIEKTSPGQVGVGTTFSGLYAPRDYPTDVRILEYDPPRRVVRETQGQAISMLIHLDLAADGNGGTRVAGSWEVRPKGWMRLLEPVIRRAFRQQLELRQEQIVKGLAKRTAPSA